MAETRVRIPVAVLDICPANRRVFVFLDPTSRQDSRQSRRILSPCTLAATVTPAETALPASKTQINKAGDVLRKTAEEHRRPGDEYRDALILVRAYRAAHSYPLTHVTMGLRYHAKKAAGDSWLDIGQRLKQLPTITDKLVRMPKTNLARVQDIGGCRATFLDQATVDATIASIESRAKPGMSWDIVDIDDYVSEKTRPDGYRAKHVIVRKHGLQIEMQFRTFAQHNWAELVESLDKSLGLGLKQGRADTWAVESVASAADDMRRYELGEIDRPSLIEALNSSLKPILDLAGGAQIG
jgi:putative GTP pyrophosphokinase